MTSDDLHALILANPQAKARVDIGDDAGAAAVMSAALPSIIVPTLVTERDLYKAFANPADAIRVVTVLELVATGDPTANPAIPANPAVAACLRWMQPANGGVDAGNTAVRSMLDSLVGSGTNQLTQSQVNTIKSLAQQPQIITADQISAAWLQERPNGQIGGNPS